MEEKNNYRLFGYLAIFIIVISLFNIGVRLTGKVTDTGYVNVSIEPIVQINFTTYNVDFGFGAVNPGFPNATIDTLGNVINGNWTPIVGGFVIENKGNQNVLLQLKSGKNANQLIGGSNSKYMYRVIDQVSENGSCVSGINLGSWYDVNTTLQGTIICGNFSSDNTKDEVHIDIKLVIPSDSSTGSQSDTLLATATAI